LAKTHINDGTQVTRQYKHKLYEPHPIIYTYLTRYLVPQISRRYSDILVQ